MKEDGLLDGIDEASCTPAGLIAIILLLELAALAWAVLVRLGGA